MDPCSALGLVSGAVTIVLTIGATVQRLRTIRDTYSSSEEVIDSIVNRLTVIRCSIDIVAKSEDGAKALHPTAQEYRAALKLSLEGCHKVINNLDIQVGKLYDANGRVGFRQKGRYLFNGDCLKEYLSRLDNEIQSLNLLLSCYQNVALQEQNRLLRERSSRVRVRAPDNRTVNSPQHFGLEEARTVASSSRAIDRAGASFAGSSSTCRRQFSATGGSSMVTVEKIEFGGDDNTEGHDNFFYSSSDADESEPYSEDEETLVENDDPVVPLTSTSPPKNFNNPYLGSTKFPPSPPDSLPDSSPIKFQCQSSAAMPPTPPDSLPESSPIMDHLEHTDTFYHSRSESSDDAYSSSLSSSNSHLIVPRRGNGCLSTSAQSLARRLQHLQAFSESEDEGTMDSKGRTKNSRYEKGKAKVHNTKYPSVSNQRQALEADGDFDSSDSIFHLEM